MITGIAPQTLASKRSWTPAAEAAAKSSAPRWASSCLFAVTTGLPAARSSSTWPPVGSTPPMTSATSSISGSSRIEAKSVVRTPSGAGKLRCAAGSRTSALTTRSRWPVALTMSSSFSSSSRVTAEPTVPYPSSATGTSVTSVMLVARRAG